MKSFSEIVRQPGFVRIVLINGDPLRFNYEYFVWGEKGIHFKISRDNTAFIPYSAIAYAYFTSEEVKENAQA